MSTWEIWLDDARGNRLTLLERAHSWELVRAVNDVGSFQIALPGDYAGMVDWDYLIEFWRAPEGAGLKWEGTGFVTDIREAYDADGMLTLKLAGPDVNDLLDRRIVAYPAGDTNADETGAADDLMKRVVKENLGASSTDTTRDLSAYGFSVDLDASLGPSIHKAFAWRNVLAVLRDLAEASRQADDPIYFDVVASEIAANQIGLKFMTYAGQRGADRTDDSGAPVYFGMEWGNVREPELVRSRRDEANYAYVGGKGEEADRAIEQVSDTVEMSASPWNRREKFHNGSNQSDSDGLYAAGLQVLSENRRRYKYTAALVDVELYRYGRDWSLGDRATVVHAAKQFDAEIRAVKLAMSENGQETIDARIEADL